MLNGKIGISLQIMNTPRPRIDCAKKACGTRKIIPGIRDKIDHIEAATPGLLSITPATQMELLLVPSSKGLKYPMNYNHAPGLYHAGSVGIIMSGWLGTINYGVITANKIDSFLRGKSTDRLSTDTEDQALPLPEKP